MRPSEFKSCQHRQNFLIFQRVGDIAPVPRCVGHSFLTSTGETEERYFSPRFLRFISVRRFVGWVCYRFIFVYMHKYKFLSPKNIKNTEMKWESQQGVFMSDETIPPLPELEISGLTSKYLDQSTVDQAMLIIYQRKPSLFTKLAERDRAKSDSGGKIKKELYDFIRGELREEIKVSGLMITNSIAWEARRRARIMYGMPI